MPSLRMTKGDSPGKEFALDRVVTVIGKKPVCDIVLPDVHVSEIHARIEYTPDGMYIEDLDSTNHTKVGGRAIKRRRLKDGDIIKIAGYQFQYVEGGEPPGITATIVSEMDAAAVADGTTSEIRTEEKLRAIMEIVMELTGVLELGTVLDHMLGALFRIFPQAERAFVLLKDTGGNDIRTAAIKLRQVGPAGSVVSRTVYDYVTGEGRAVLCEDMTADEVFKQSPSVRASRARTLMCVPLWDHERHPVGVLQVDTQADECRFGRDDLDFLVAVAGSLGMALETARLHDIAVRHEKTEQEGRDARAVQQALLPAEPPDVPGYEFWHNYEPARHVGGDYFDYRPLPGAGPQAAPERASRWAIAIGDVAGKGMPAALLMFRTSSEVRLLLQAGHDNARVAALLNQSLCDGRTEERFVTMLVAVLDADRHELTVANAGHQGLLVRRTDGRIEVLGEECGGCPLGIDAGQTYRTESTILGAGDVVVAYTDGVTDATSAGGSRFGGERLSEVLASAAGGPALVGEAIWDAARRHAEGHDPFDDMTLIAFGRR